MAWPLAATALLVVVLLTSGCESGGYPRSEADKEMFGPKAIRVHPTFTRVKDWTGDGKPDGIEAVVELQDEFGEPTRATGTVMFELYQYRQNFPDPRGRRVPQVWVWPLIHKNEQVGHWSRALRAYTFKIGYDPGRQPVVLGATFRLGDGRLFDQMIVEPAVPVAPLPTTAPATAPARTPPADAPADAAAKPAE
jgi:hypothetical protein